MAFPIVSLSKQCCNEYCSKYTFEPKYICKLIPFPESFFQTQNLELAAGTSQVIQSQLPHHLSTIGLKTSQGRGPA